MIEQLMKLAGDAQIPTYASGKLQLFYNATNPAAIKRMCEVMLQMRDALEECHNIADPKLFNNDPDAHMKLMKTTTKAIAAFDEFNKE